jgi:hypothetical protein
MKTTSLLALAFGAILLLSSCSQTAAGKRAIAYYVNPMDATIRSDRPFKDPMGMDYKPVYVDELAARDKRAAAGSWPSGYAPVNIPEQRQRLIGMRTVKARSAEIEKNLLLFGTVSHDVELFNGLQDYVTATRFADGEVLVRAAERKLNLLGLTPVQARVVLDAIGWDPGVFFSGVSGVGLIDVEVFPQDAALVKPGLRAEVKLSSVDGRRFTGSLIGVGKSVNAMTRTIPAHVLIRDPAFDATHLTWVDVTITVPLGRNLVVPEEAVLETGTRSLVFVAMDGGTFAPREVTTGVRGGRFVAVTAGLAEDERVVLDGLFFIDAESKTAAAIAR